MSTLPSPSPVEVQGVRATFHVAPRDVVEVLWWGVATLAGMAILLSIVEFTLGYDHLRGVVPLFTLSMENNVPTWFTGALHVTAALVLLTIARDPELVPRTGGERTDRRYWYGLAAVFGYLSLDEITQLHERLNAPTKAIVDSGGLLYYAWIIPAALAVLVVGVIYLPFLMRMPRATMRRFVVAAVLFVGGALGGEMLEGLLYSSDLALQLKRVLIRSVTIVEETAEMAGIVVFIQALLLLIVHGRMVRPRSSVRPGGSVRPGA